MSGQAPLEYYVAAAVPVDAHGGDSADSARPTGATAVAVVGIVLVGLLLVGHALRLWNGMWEPPSAEVMTLSSGPPYVGTFKDSSSLPPVGTLVVYAAGSLVRSLFTVLMLIGCCGVLAVRPGARRLMLVSAVVWMVLGGIEFYLLYAAHVRTAVLGPNAPEPPLVVPLAVLLLGDLAYPIWVIVTLRRRGVRTAFERRAAAAAAPAAVLRLHRPVATVVLVLGALGVLNGMATLNSVVTGNSDRPYYVARLLTPPRYDGEYGDFAPGGKNSGWLTVDSLLVVAVDGTFAAGGLLVLMRRRAGRRLIACASVLMLTFIVYAWGSSGRARFYGVSDVAVDAWGRGGSGRAFWVVFSRYVAVLEGYAATLVTSVLLLILFSHRPPVDTAGLEPGYEAGVQ